MKPKLLYLTHRIPYPPNKGDKIRSFHWLKELSEHYDIHLGTFVDDENDWQYAEHLNEYCTDTHIEKLSSRSAKLRSLTGLLRGKPLTLPYYANESMQKWVDQIVKKENIHKIFVFSSAMAQFVESNIFSNCQRVIDFVDMDSDKWAQYAEKKSWPMSWVYQREATTLLTYEKNIARIFDKSLFVSNDEAKLFSSQLDEDKAKIDFVNNGVNTHYFSPNETFLSPFKRDEKNIVFTGAMDYWANVDAVKWFANDIFPLLVQQVPAVRFVIVGSKPTPEVKALASIPGVSVTGFVEDVRPYLMHGDVVVAPMRIARGIQNKVLEAMAMAKTVVVSPQGFEGLNVSKGEELLLSTSPQEWVNNIIGSIVCPDEKIGQRARSRVKKHYSWHSNAAKLMNSL